MAQLAKEGTVVRVTIAAAVLFLGVFTSSGCASLFAPGPDAVTFNSDPQGATVRVDGEEVGQTPCTAEVSRRADRVEFSKQGYQTLSMDVPRTFNAISILNILTLNLGWFVDIATSCLQRAEHSAFGYLSPR